MIYSSATELNNLDAYSKLDAVANVFSCYKSFHRNEICTPSNYYVVRVRLEPEPFDITTKQELSYIADPSKIKVRLGRCHLENKPVFYGSTNPNSSRLHQKHAIQSAILEASSMRRLNTVSDFEEFGYVGIWRTTCVLNHFTFFVHNFGTSHDSDMLKLRKESIKLIREKSTSPDRDIEINHWIASIFAQDFEPYDDSAYVVSSKFGDKFHQTHDGILYPSIQSFGMAVNIALRPSAADTLTLEKVYPIINYRRHGVTGVDFGDPIDVRVLL